MKNNLVKVITLFIITTFFLITIHYGIKCFIYEKCIVTGTSMLPTYHSGETIWINKKIIGARISFKDKSINGGRTFIRLPGKRSIAVGDIAVFNMPYGEASRHISFDPYYVFIKRCVGCPGDTIYINNCRYYNSKKGYEVGIPESATNLLFSTPDSILIMNRCFKAGQFASKEDEWTVKYFGPVAIPYKGMVINLDSLSIKLYSSLLEYETGRSAKASGEQYIFIHDYYFLAGDNVSDSNDSRYFGLVPDDFIIGVASTLF